MFGLGALLVIFSAFQLLQGAREDAAAVGEYGDLRDLGAEIWSPSDTAESLPEAEDAVAVPNPMLGLLEINSDFVGWIRVPGTSVDYPIVRGADNAVYLYTTFGGEQNPAGAIFMDYRARDGFGTPVTILYGHNMRNGTMFASLHQYKDPDFLARYPEITIMTVDGTLHTYRIFDVRYTDAWDAVYRLDFKDIDQAEAFFAPWGMADASHVLVLSTCVDGAGRDARLLVSAQLVHTQTAAFMA